jgi:hypothetical protein
VDSNYVYYLSPYSGNEVAMYNLRAAPGTVDTIHGWGPLGRSRVEWVATRQIFGLERTVRRYFIDGLVQFEVSLAEGFGIVDALNYDDGIWPFYAWWSIRGCIIRDTLYGTTVDVTEDHELPTQARLYQSYPNPFNPSTTIEFDIPVSGPIRLTVVDLLGREVAELVNQVLSAGRHKATFTGTNCASGVYVCILSTQNGVLQRSLMLLK